jgi:hypothetical protein
MFLRAWRTSSAPLLVILMAAEDSEEVVVVAADEEDGVAEVNEVVVVSVGTRKIEAIRWADIMTMIKLARDRSSINQSDNLFL